MEVYLVIETRRFLDEIQPITPRPSYLFINRFEEIYIPGAYMIPGTIYPGTHDQPAISVAHVVELTVIDDFPNTFTFKFKHISTISKSFIFSDNIRSI